MEHSMPKAIAGRRPAFVAVEKKTPNSFHSGDARNDPLLSTVPVFEGGSVCREPPEW
jgi:hypothetical protein